MSSVVVLPTYASIECVRDISEPWITLWSGDEWGEVMQSLHGACHTDYGFSDEDCALFASKLIENLEIMKRFWEGDNYGLWGYGYDSGDGGEEALAKARKEATERRDYWRKGGNLNWEPAVTAANKTIDTLPTWLFEDDSE